MRTVTRIISLLLVALVLTSCRSNESEEEMTSRYVDSISSVEGVTEVETRWGEAGGVAGPFHTAFIQTDTNELEQLQAIQYHAWEALVPTIEDGSLADLRWEVVSADSTIAVDLTHLGFRFDSSSEGILKRQWEKELREHYDGPK